MLIKPRIQEVAASIIHAQFGLDLSPEQIVVQRTDASHEGQFTIVLFPLLKHKIGRVEEIGDILGKELLNRFSAIQSFTLVKGFLNLSIAPAFWLNFLAEFATQGIEYLKPNIGNNIPVMVEFPSPNTNKPIHLGHLRNIFLGDSVSRILDACGFKVIRTCLFNDKGIHICKSMLAYERFGNAETPATTNIKGDLFVGNYYVAFDKAYKAEVAQLVASGIAEEEAEKIAPLQQSVQDLYRQWEAQDPVVLARWREMNGWVYDGFQQTFNRLHIHFDKLYYESDTYLLGKKVVQEGLEKGIFYAKDDGSVWIDLTDAGLDHKLLLRSDGTSVYITQDLGTADLKASDFGIERSIYVIGNEQDYHMQVLIAILKRLERPYANGVYHLSYGMVELPTGRMKSREGTVVDADDLLDEMYAEAQKATQEHGKTEGLTTEELDTLYHTLSQGALKYYLLKVHAPKKIIFNPEESIDFKGHTGTFIQFIHARIASLLRKANEQGITPECSAKLELLPIERDLIMALHLAPEVVEDAARQYNPAIIANYVYDIAQYFSRFYYECPVLIAEDPAVVRFRLLLCAQTGMTIKFLMEVLGICVPERM